MLFLESMMAYPYIENYMPNDKPPTLYAILNSLVNFNQEEKTKIYDLPEKGADLIFDFEYITFPYDWDDVTQEYVKSWQQRLTETSILEHFIERRIGFETITSFKIHLKNKMNEVMPVFMQLFYMTNAEDNFFMYDEWNERTHDEETSGETSGGTINKYSDTPQGQLSKVSDDSYLTDYRDISVSGEDSGTREFTEGYRMMKPREAYLQMITAKNSSIFEKLYNDLECLFYQLD